MYYCQDVNVKYCNIESLYFLRECVIIWQRDVGFYTVKNKEFVMSDNSSPNVPDNNSNTPVPKSVPVALIIAGVIVVALAGAVALFMVFPNFQ